MRQSNVFEGVPGVDYLISFRPETGRHLYDLALALLDGESPLTRPKRKLIAAYVSHLNKYMTSGKKNAGDKEDEEKNIIDKLVRDMKQVNISDKMKALLNIAFNVQVSGKEVKDEDVADARKYGADDRTIHDTVLIAATFNMLNRYAEALASLKPEG